MSSPELRVVPPDQAQRDLALDPARSVLVQAPAGSGKTTLLAGRFLRLLGEVEEPGQIVAITFTNAAAAEMRHRILDELRNPQPSPLARRVLSRSQALGWKLLDLPTQLRISTIDSFCRDLALQQPLLSTLGGGLDIHDRPEDLYRRAARRTLEKIDAPDAALNAAIEALLLWRDNSWRELENLLATMLGKRDQWMHEFVLNREPGKQEMEALRARLERPFTQANLDWARTFARICSCQEQIHSDSERLLELARFANRNTQGQRWKDLAERASIPKALEPSSSDRSDLLDLADFGIALADFLLTTKAKLRTRWTAKEGFPSHLTHRLAKTNTKKLKDQIGRPPAPEARDEKEEISQLVDRLGTIPGFESCLADAQSLPPPRYTEEDWHIVCACFTVLRHAAGELQVVFAEAGAVDFIEVAQIAQRALRGPDGLPTDAALALADGIHHLLVDEFQDTSRRQHQLLASLAAAWPDPAGRTCFVVGDPMQSIYSFRDADAELFGRVKNSGLEIAQEQPFRFDSAALTANFRTAEPLVITLNDIFTLVFADDDGSGIGFAPAQPARGAAGTELRYHLHLGFVPQTARSQNAADPPAGERAAAHAAQVDEIVALIQGHQEHIRSAREHGEKYRVAVLGRTRSALTPIAAALREAAIPFRAVDLEQLAGRPEVLDALALAHALLNPMDRVAWLGVLRAPWCGLPLESLHRLTSADDPALLARPVPGLLAERLALIDKAEQVAVKRLLDAVENARWLRAAQPAAALGTWLEQVWLGLGGAACVDAAAHANLDLLWKCLDRLPGGEQDMLGPALDAALKNLTAQPDPEASSECGVQLMTIHKSKGLEFEVVIVPELQARNGKTAHKMLSWLERGLATPDDSGEITEFLVAPFQPKGADRGRSKAWVDRAYRDREMQEMRRILYVAATRARESLHFFARPAYTTDKTGALTLATPANCLLASAWPALGKLVQLRFEDWKTEKASPTQTAKETAVDIAAGGQDNLVLLPRPARLRRLPAEFQPAGTFAFETKTPAAANTEPATLYTRHQGGLLSRALGTAVHLLLQELARLRATLDWDEARASILKLQPRLIAQIRSMGADPAQAAALAAQAERQALAASQDPSGQWILSPHPEAASEAGWAGVVAGAPRTVRVDRVFRAGDAPRAGGDSSWWIVDYKTAHAENVDPAAALPELRRLFAPQLELYARVLRNLRGADTPIRAGLYYPRMLQFDWWEV